MADNVAITAGTGTNVATDDVSGVHFQRVKLVDGTLDGSEAIAGDAANGLDVDVTRLPSGTVAGSSSLPAGTNNIGDVDIASIAAGDNNIGNVDVVTLPNVTLAAGTNTNEVVGDVAHDSPAAGNPVLVAGKASAAAPTDVSADNDAVTLWLLRNGAQATVITAAGALIGGDATNGLDVDVTRLPSGTVAGSSSLPAGTNNIGDVDVLTLPNVTLAAGTNTNEVVGDAAHDAAAAGNPVLVAGKASAAAPTSVDADGDVVTAWRLRNGAEAVVITAAGALVGGDATNGLDVDVTRLPTGSIAAATSLPAGTNNIGDVDVLTLPNVTLAAGTNTNEVVGDAAHDAAAAGNPVLVAGKASAAAPTSVDADGDVVTAWRLRNGAEAVVITAAGALVGGDATNGLDVDVTRVKPDGTNTMPSLDAAARRGYVTVTDGTNSMPTADAAARRSYHQLTDGTLSVGAVDETGSSAVDALAVGGGTPHDSVDSGNPIKIGAKAISALSGATMVAAGDRANLVCDLDGALITRMCPISDVIVERVTNTDGAATNLTSFGATASAKNVISTIAVYNEATTTSGYVNILDGSSPGTVLMTLPLPAGGGAVINLPVPLVQPTANNALRFDVSAAISTIYLSFIGFKSKA